MRLVRTAAALLASVAAHPALAHVAARSHGHPHVEDGAFGLVEVGIAALVVTSAVAIYAWDRRGSR